MGHLWRWMQLGPRLRLVMVRTYALGIAAVALPLALYLTLRLSPDPAISVPREHFAIVSVVSLGAAVFAAAVGWAAHHLRNLQITFLALAFFSLAAFFSLHGLTTPGMLLGPNNVVSVAVSLSLGSAAVFLALATLPASARPLRWLGRHQRALVAAWTATVVLVCASGLLAPQLWSGATPPASAAGARPAGSPDTGLDRLNGSAGSAAAEGSSLAGLKQDSTSSGYGPDPAAATAGYDLAGGSAIVADTAPHALHEGQVPSGYDRVIIDGWDITVVVLSALALTRFLRAYRYARQPLQLSLSLASAWLMVAQIIATTSTVWRLSWWLYHFLLLAAVLAMLYGLVRYQTSSGSWLSGLQALFHADPLERLARGLSPGLASLVTATEVRDAYTAGHGRRVAELAIRIGQMMDLPPEALRALAQGGWIHDLGKIGIPDHILNKPGALTPEERALIEAHPEHGYRIAVGLGTLADELDLIRYHHERWDGGGYPSGLRGPQIPVLARILAIADVYDALTSRRAYREPWTPERALAHIRSGAGSHFDPVCVAAFEQLIAAGGPELAIHGTATPSADTAGNGG